MNVLLVSNYFNHHQKSLCTAILKQGDRLSFVETDDTHQQGYQTRLQESYVIQYRGNEKAIEEQIQAADVVIFGACPNHLIALRMAENKLSFLYSERFFKKGTWRRFIPQTRKNVTERIVQYKDKRLYALCASAFLPYDLKLLGFLPEKCFRWGYFPENKTYQIADLCAKKDRRRIMWAGRFLDWKHPDDALQIAKRLKDAGNDFHMDIVGTGEMETQLKGMADNMDLRECVTFLGSMPPDEVRGLMEQAGIYLFTSDRNEGWGAVLNESMNSGCAVVASHVIGSVPYLMKHRENGLIYKSGDVDGLYAHVKYLLDNPGEQERLGRAAYETITGLWNAEIAAQRLIALSEHLLAGEKYPDLFEDGPCSRAEIVKDNWFCE